MLRRSLCAIPSASVSARRHASQTVRPLTHSAATVSGKGKILAGAVGAVNVAPPKTIEDLRLHMPPHRYSFFSDDYRMPHLTYETSRLEDDAGIVTVENKYVVPEKTGDAAVHGAVKVSPAAAAAVAAATPPNMTLCNMYKKHREPADWCDRLARGLVTFSRTCYDVVARYGSYNHDLRGEVFPPVGADGKPTDAKAKPILNADGSKCPLAPADFWLQRAIFLETVAAVPGMVAAMLRHLQSLRVLKKDDGWIHALLEEAENERMHLFFFLKQKQPGIAFRCCIAGAQGVFWIFNFVGYLISPRFMHRFVGYIEEEAVHTYSIILKDIDRGLTAGDARHAASNLPADHISHWRTKPAPADYIRYYDLEPTATYRDVVLCIRADELSHREHNHMYADAHALNAQDHVGRILTESAPLRVVPPDNEGPASKVSH